MRKLEYSDEELSCFLADIGEEGIFWDATFSEEKELDELYRQCSDVEALISKVRDEMGLEMTKERIGGLLEFVKDNLIAIEKYGPDTTWEDCWWHWSRV